MKINQYLELELHILCLNFRYLINLTKITAPKDIKFYFLKQTHELLKLNYLYYSQYSNLVHELGNERHRHRNMAAFTFHILPDCMVFLYIFSKINYI